MEQDKPLFKTTPETVFFFILFALGIIFYFSWGVAFGVWFDVGVYAVTVIFCGFGLVGLFLYSYMAVQEEQGRDKKNP